MILGIDAANLRGGGGVTHVVEFLRAADPADHGFSKIVVWSGRATLDRIEARPWLVKEHARALDGNLFSRLLWHRLKLSKLARAAECDILFAPGGSYAGDFRPVVTMSQNLLPFEWRELRRYGWSFFTLKLLMLRWSQSRTFRRADGLIFLTQYARDRVTRAVQALRVPAVIVPHGLDGRFFRAPREQLPIENYSIERPFTILYVSIVDLYKHQWHLAAAVAALRRSRLPLALKLVGPARKSALRRLNRTLDRVDPERAFVELTGPVEHSELPAQHAAADLCAFASSCENMPNILLEGMASGLPIVCSSRGPMPEVLGDAGRYFDPENQMDIRTAIAEMIRSPQLRTTLAQRSFALAQGYSWRNCAHETLGFLAKIAASSSA